jgi:hypothetical protein
MPFLAVLLLLIIGVMDKKMPLSIPKPRADGQDSPLCQPYKCTLLLLLPVFHRQRIVRGKIRGPSIAIQSKFEGRVDKKF